MVVAWPCWQLLQKGDSSDATRVRVLEVWLLRPAAQLVACCKAGQLLLAGLMAVVQPWLH